MISRIEETAGAMVAFAVIVPLALLWVAVMIDLFKREDLSPLRKAMWATLAVFTAHIGVLLYFVFRPIPSPPGKGDRVSTARSSQIVDGLERLRAAHRSGEIDDAGYRAAKRELLGIS